MSKDARGHHSELWSSTNVDIKTELHNKPFQIIKHFSGRQPDDYTLFLLLLFFVTLSTSIDGRQCQLYTCVHGAHN